ncbi:MAG: hypothetical protein HQK77_03300 [Desulfobacterales bacterium]|nr:hypothetical protein [Desulfobacterales bacterium]
MTKKLTITMVLVFAVMFGTTYCFAGRGQGNGAGDGTGPIHDILSGTSFEYEGDVIGWEQGKGIQIATANGNVSVQGLGPMRFWFQQGLDKPVVGDTIKVSGYTVNYNGVDVNIAMSIEIDGKTIQLRDAQTGAPLWKGTNGQGCKGANCQGMNKGNCIRKCMKNASCPNNTQSEQNNTQSEE